MNEVVVKSGIDEASVVIARAAMVEAEASSRRTGRSGIVAEIR